MIMGSLRTILAVAVFAAAGGCQSLAERYTGRYGPSPTMRAAEVATAVDNQVELMSSFVRASGAGFNAPASWYGAMEAGFNYVDERCDDYITNLFVANREKDKVKGIAILLDKTVGAALAVSSASHETIVLVAQAFGFAEGATELVAGSYLFQIDPSHIQNLVREMRNAYRVQAYARREYFATPTAAYHGVRGYLNLCLPQTIEGRINELIGKSRSFPDQSTAAGPFIELLVGSEPPQQRADVASAQNIATIPPAPTPRSPMAPRMPPVVVMRPRPTPAGQISREEYQAAIATRQAALKAYADFVRSRPERGAEADAAEEHALTATLSGASARVQELERRMRPAEQR